MLVSREFRAALEGYQASQGGRRRFLESNEERRNARDDEDEEVAFVVGGESKSSRSFGWLVGLVGLCGREIVRKLNAVRLGIYLLDGSFGREKR